MEFDDITVSASDGETMEDHSKCDLSVLSERQQKPCSSVVDDVLYASDCSSSSNESTERRHRSARMQDSDVCSKLNITPSVTAAVAMTVTMPVTVAVPISATAVVGRCALDAGNISPQSEPTTSTSHHRTQHTSRVGDLLVLQTKHAHLKRSTSTPAINIIGIDNSRRKRSVKSPVLGYSLPLLDADDREPEVTPTREVHTKMDTGISEQDKQPNQQPQDSVSGTPCSRLRRDTGPAAVWLTKSRSTDTERERGVARVRRYSTSTLFNSGRKSPASAMSPPLVACGKGSDRISQLMLEDCARMNREVDHEREVQFNMQLSSSWDELRVSECVPTAATAAAASVTPHSQSHSPTSVALGLQATAARRHHSLTEPLHIHASPLSPLSTSSTSSPNTSNTSLPISHGAGVPNVHSNFPSPGAATTAIANRVSSHKQCYSPHLKQALNVNVLNRSGTPSPSPSPTRKSFLTRSLSPVMRPSPLSGVKRKFDGIDGTVSDGSSSCSGFSSPKRLHMLVSGVGGACGQQQHPLSPSYQPVHSPAATASLSDYSCPVPAINLSTCAAGPAIPLPPPPPMYSFSSCSSMDSLMESDCSDVVGATGPVSVAAVSSAGSKCVPAAASASVPSPTTTPSTSSASSHNLHQCNPAQDTTMI